MRKNNYRKVLQHLEQEIQNVERRLSGYLHCRQKYRLTDDGDITAENFNGIVKNNEDLKYFINYHYFLGKWAAYMFVLSWLFSHWRVFEEKEHKVKKQSFADNFKEEYEAMDN